MQRRAEHLENGGVEGHGCYLSLHAAVSDWSSCDPLGRLMKLDRLVLEEGVAGMENEGGYGFGDRDGIFNKSGSVFWILNDG